MPGKTIAVIIADKTDNPLYSDPRDVSPGEQRSFDMVAAKSDTARPHLSSDGSATITAGVDGVLITGEAGDGGVAGTSLPVLCLNPGRWQTLLMCTGTGSPPTNAAWRPAAGSTGSTFLAGRTAVTAVWSAAQAHRFAITPAPGAQVVWELNSGTSRFTSLYLAQGAEGSTGAAASGDRYGISMVESAAAGGWTATSAALLGAGYDVLFGGVAAPDELTVTVTGGGAFAGGDPYTLTATISGGTAPYSVAWTHTGAVPENRLGTTSTTCRATMPVGGGETVWTCTVTDAASDVVSAALTVTASPRQVYGLGASTLPAGWTTSTGSSNPATVLDDAIDGPTLTNDYVDIPGGTQVHTQPITFPSTADANGLDVYFDVALPAVLASGSVLVELLDGATVRGSESPTLDLTRTSIQRLRARFTPAECTAVVNAATVSIRYTITTPA